MQDGTKIQPPFGRVLRSRHLEGLPEKLQVERLTGSFVNDFRTFKFVNPQYKPRDAWYWFKEVIRRYGLEIEDTDWDGDPEEIGQRGSQPEQEPYGDSRHWDPKYDGRDDRTKGKRRDDRRSQGFSNQAPASAGWKGCPEGSAWGKEYWEKDPWSHNDPWSNRKEKKEKARPS